MDTQSQLLLNASRYIIDRIKEEFIKQGHRLTGDWEQSLIAQSPEDGFVEIMATGYGMIVNAGITPERIPFGGTGTGGDGAISAYIAGLVRFWKLRKPALTDAQALRLAFATATVQKEEGMSTEASVVYSSTGERQNFMDTLVTLFSDFLDDWIFTGMGNIVDITAKEPKIMYL